MTESASQHGQWRSRWTYFLAATGSAVGLGNIWKFPYITGENGGGAFVLVYLACIALVGLPVLIAEVAIGRRGRAGPRTALLRLAREAGASVHWRWLGWIAAVTGLLILSFYTVVAGWSLFYLVAAAGGALDSLNAAGTAALFNAFTGDPWLLTLCSSLFLLVTMACIARGVEKGIEASLRYVMPGMLLLLLVLVGYALAAGDFAAALHFLFAPDFSELSLDGALIALGHAFFTLGLGAGAMMVYGAYIPEGVSLARSGVDIALADTAIALLAGLALFPLVFAWGLAPESGPGLIFVSLPIAFAQMPYGAVIGTVFFGMLALAAYSSAISMIEAMTAIVIERWQWSRRRTAALLGSIVWLMSLGTVFSFNLWQDGLVGGMTFFELLDYLTANILLPLVSFGTAIFVGWCMGRETVRETVRAGTGRWFALWYGVLRYLSPVAIALIFLVALGAA